MRHPFALAQLVAAMGPIMLGVDDLAITGGG